MDTQPSSNGLSAAPSSKAAAAAPAAAGAPPPGAGGGGRLALRPWHRRFRAQLAALSLKNALVYTRNARASALRLSAPLFFMGLLYLTDLAIRQDNANLDAYAELTDPPADAVGAIPACADDPALVPPCWDFLYSNPSGSPDVEAVVAGIQANNGDRPIPDSAVAAFGSIADAQAFMLANPSKVLGAYHFLTDTQAPGSVAFVLQVNQSVVFWKDRFQDPTFFAAVPMQVAAEREIARLAANRTAAAAGAPPPPPTPWAVSTSMFAHPAVQSINIVGQAMGPFVFAANMFNFVLLLSNIVLEREKGLRQALATAGMLASAFWSSWAAVEVALAAVFSLLLIAFGAMFQFDFFLNNSFGLVFLLFFLFQVAMTAVAFALSTGVSRAQTAVNLGFVIFIFGWIVQSVVAFGYPYTPDYVGSIPLLTAAFTIFPFTLLAKASLDLGAASEDGGPGIPWSRRYEYCQDIDDAAQQDAKIATDPGAYWDFDCVLPLGTVLGALALQAAAYCLIAVYLDQVLPNEHGVRQPPWFFLQPSYWVGGGGRRRAPPGLRPPAPLPPGAAPEPGAADPDVAAEEARMRELAAHRTGAPGALADAAGEGAAGAAAVEVYGLQMRFGGRGRAARAAAAAARALCFWRRRRGTGAGGARQAGAPFWAVKGPWFSIEAGRLFCLLGPNGAGKSTVINLLTGVLPPTGGDALVYGQALAAPGGVDRVRAAMGVCPQFDVLWPELTGREHLALYGAVKGLRARAVAAEAAGLLASVQLEDAARLRTGAYSGGMRRRLSVALALLGDPLVVYLDEPTTGMDPVSRRAVWDAIQAAKPGRAVVLTTHSMEEADILGDRVGIMARGRLRALGSPLRLKQRFGSGYELAVAARAGEGAAAVRGLFARRLGAAPEAGAGARHPSGNGYETFLVPKDREPELPAALRELEAGRDGWGVTDTQISLTSLEEVFLAIAKAAELEAAEAEGRAAASILLDDGRSLEVPLGDDEVADAGDGGRRYRVKWAQDEAGRLQVLSWEAV